MKNIKYLPVLIMNDTKPEPTKSTEPVSLISREHLMIALSIAIDYYEKVGSSKSGICLDFKEKLEDLEAGRYLVMR